MTNHPARARDSEPVDWISLSIASLAAIAFSVTAWALCMAWPLL